MLAPINVKAAQPRHSDALLAPGAQAASRRGWRIHQIPVDQGGAQQRMREADRPARQPLQQVVGGQIEVLGEVLCEEVNLAIWQRRLPTAIDAFATALLARGEPLADFRVLELAHSDSPVALGDLLQGYAELPGHAAFVADVAWLVGAFACLLDATRIGLRLRILDKAMCPRFHVDHVPLRLITCYAGVGSQWLRDGAMARGNLGEPSAEPQDDALIERSAAGDVLLSKGEKWQGNEGGGLIHRSPQPPAGERRLLLTLDWLA